MDAGDINPKLQWRRIVPRDQHMVFGFRCREGAAGMAALQRHSGIAATTVPKKNSKTETGRRAGALRDSLKRELQFIESSEATLASTGNVSKTGKRKCCPFHHLKDDVEFEFTREEGWKGSEKGELKWISLTEEYPYKEIKDPQAEHEESDSESGDSLANSE